MIYLYDGSFYGLLTCVYEHYYVEEVNEIFDTHRFMGTLIDETKFEELPKENTMGYNVQDITSIKTDKKGREYMVDIETKKDTIRPAQGDIKFPRLKSKNKGNQQSCTMSFECIKTHVKNGTLKPVGITGEVNEYSH